MDVPDAALHDLDGSPFTLLANFPDFKIFGLQRQLFEHIDQHEPRGLLRPWCIESRTPLVGHSSYRNGASQRTNHVSAPKAGATTPQRASIFNTGASKRPRFDDEGEQAAPANANGAARPPQTRFFLAASLADAARYYRRLKLGAQHLYELIREERPCHLYLDVEKNFADEFFPEASSWRPTVATVDGILTDTAAGELMDGIRDVQLVAARCCRASCTLLHDAAATCRVLTRELSKFMRDVLAVEVVDQNYVVLSSRPLDSKTVATKFSQHYVMRLDAERFANNIDIGGVVDLFVTRMRAAAAHDDEIHCALFYHGEPSDAVGISVDRRVEGVVISTRCPALPLRCVIDGAVYSRNRVMRCIGSSKLGKSAVLDLDPSWPPNHALCASVEDLFALTLISQVDESVPLRIIDSQLIEAAYAVDGRAVHRPGVRPTSGSAALTKSSGSGLGSAHGGSTRADIDTAIISVAAAAPRDAPAARPTSAHPTMFIYSHSESNNTLLLTIGGRRFCGNANREHKSNNVFYVVDLSTLSYSQRCFDPDCRGYRGPSTLLPAWCLGALATRTSDTASAQTSAPATPAKPAGGNDKPRRTLFVSRTKQQVAPPWPPLAADPDLRDRESMSSTRLELITPPPAQDSIADETMKTGNHADTERGSATASPIVATTALPETEHRTSRVPMAMGSFSFALPSPTPQSTASFPPPEWHHKRAVKPKKTLFVPKAKLDGVHSASLDGSGAPPAPVAPRRLLTKAPMALPAAMQLKVGVVRASSSSCESSSDSTGASATSTATDDSE
jgi:hypothetical protein